MSLRYEAFTRSLAFFDMVIKADFELSLLNGFFGQIETAASYPENLIDETERIFHALHFGIRSEILRSVLNYISGRKDLGVRFIGDPDVGERFVVLEKDIIPRL